MLKDFLSKEIVYLGLGSNVGDKIESISRAIDLLAKMPRVDILKVSSLYETEPVELKTDDLFINCVVMIETDFACFEMLFILKEMEATLGRVKGRECGAREIDIDILVWENRVLGSDALTIPHKEIANRKFVLIPLNELNSTLEVPRYNKRPAELLEQMSVENKRYEVKQVHSERCLWQ
ncbi:2-amino-4-hydroxy-6-hydroxymethyldihydropteridine diphosphokinase [Candidatus Auribacterota bacterium]